MDDQFDTRRIRGSVEELNVTLKPVSEDDNVPGAERYTRTIKEGGRYVQTTFPFRKIPGRLTMELVSSCF